MKTKSEVVQQAKNDGGLVHVALFMDLSHLKHSELQRKQFVALQVLSKEHHRCRWKQDSWIQFPDHLAWLERPTMQFQPTHSQITANAREGVSSGVEKTATQSKTHTLGRLKNQWSTLSETCTVTHKQD